VASSSTGCEPAGGAHSNAAGLDHQVLRAWQSSAHLHGNGVRPRSTTSTTFRARSMSENAAGRGAAGGALRARPLSAPTTGFPPGAARPCSYLGPNTSGRLRCPACSAWSKAWRRVCGHRSRTGCRGRFRPASYVTE